MRNIKTPEGFAVVFDHDYSFHSGNGLVSEYHFESPRFREAINKLFECKEDEVIAAVEVSRTGMKAYFERKPEEVEVYPKVVTTQRKRKKHGRTRH